MDIKSIFKVGKDIYKVSGFGQDAVGIILNQFPVKRIIFMGFLINDKFYEFV